MRRKFLRIAASTLVSLFVLWAVILAGPTTEARVESRSDVVVVLPRSGLWYHKFTVTVRPLAASADAPAVDIEADAERADFARVVLAGGAVTGQRVTVLTTQLQHDTLRTGNRVRIHTLPFLSNVSWTVDESIMLGALRALAARMPAFHHPRPVEPSIGSTSGLARVVSVHRIRGDARQSDAARESAVATDLDIIVVEYWAQRLRTLVRSADVVDARSIDDLGPGQILQMHYDQRSPRVMRLDDGMRTNLR